MESDRVPVPALTAFAARLLEAAGADPAEAATVADVLVWADRSGRPAHGIAKAPNLVDRLGRGRIRSPAKLRFTPTAPACGRLDAGDAFGPVAGTRGLEHARALAEEQGVGLCAVSRSGHFGAAGYYARRAVEAGFLALVGTNAYPKVAPHGASEPALGTNPLAFGCPVDGAPPLIVDLSTSAVSGGAVRAAQRRGKQLPEGAAFDADGMRTRDPAAMHGLRPAAGPKGYGLALMVDILSGALSGGAVGRAVGSIFDLDRPTNTGHFFLVIRLDATRPAADVRAAVGELLADVTRRPALGGARVRYPGERSDGNAAESDRDGVALPPDTKADLAALAASLGVATPW